jgi:Creatinine amidohydrolase
LDKNKTVVIVPGGILEEHGPYLPSGTDGIFNAKLANDLAHAVVTRPGWTALMMPAIPLGAGAANEMGQKYSFPGSCTILPHTLRARYLWIWPINSANKDSDGSLWYTDMETRLTTGCSIKQTTFMDVWRDAQFLRVRVGNGS